MYSLQRRFASTSIALLALIGLLAVPAPAAESPCSSDPGHAELMRWAGDWEVVQDGAVVATSTVREILEGCAFEEIRQRADGSEERGLIYLDPLDGKWRQRWLSSLGDTGSLEIEFTDEGLAVTGEIHTRIGERMWVRGTATAAEGGGFEEEGEMSLDGGASYQSMGTTLYLPPGRVALSEAAQAPVAPAADPTPMVMPAQPAPTPSPPTPQPQVVSTPEPVAPADEAVAPQPEPDEAGKVTVRSKRKAKQVELVSMESPMTLEFELGPIDALPPGTAWRTRELARFIAERVNVPLVGVSRRQRRGKSALEVTVHLRAQAVQTRVDLEVDLLSDGASVGRQEGQNIVLGKLIGSHDPEDGRPYTLRFDLDEAAFAELFADGKRPSVRLTVAVR
jgi:hypothetical protein